MLLIKFRFVFRFDFVAQPKYRDNGSIVNDLDGRHDLYARSNFHAAEHVPPTNGNTFNGNGCNGNSAVNGSRYTQHVSPISRSVNPQTEHHRHQPHPGKTITSPIV